MTGFTAGEPSVRADAVPAESNAYIAMAKLTILRYPDPRLHTVAKPVAQVDGRIRQLVDDMLETMYAAEGVGLAATQVDVHERVIVMDTSDTRDQPLVLINPEIVRSTGDDRDLEGCLSIPGYVAYVTRKEKVWVVAQNRVGKKIKVAGSGLLGRALQHELDHLDGKLFIDYLDSMDELISVRQLEDEDEDAQERLRTLA